MQKIILMSAFCAGERIVSWLLEQLTNLLPHQVGKGKSYIELSDDDLFIRGHFSVCHYNLTEDLAERIRNEEALPVFLVRNIFDLVINQYRFYLTKNIKHKNLISGSLPQNEQISSFIKGEMKMDFLHSDISTWVQQMQEMLYFHKKHKSCVLSYENLLSDTAEQTQRIVKFLSIDLPTEQIEQIVASLKPIIERKTGATHNMHEQYRHSIAYESRSMLSGYHSAMIKEILDMHAPKLRWLSATIGFPEITLEYPETRKCCTRNIFVSTVFKSGTKLLENIVANLTGLSVNTPGMGAGSDYECTAPITFEEGKFFIWHNVPSDKLSDRLREENAKPIFLIRNIYDLLVSQYYHFAIDVDKEIGHSTGTADYLATMGRDEGISLVLCGAASPYFTWPGLGYSLHHTQAILKYFKAHPCHLICYDRLVLDKRREIVRLANYLNLTASREEVDEMTKSSSIEQMRKDRVSAVGSGNHFRKGMPGDHVNVLKAQHYHMIGHLILTQAPDLVALCKELNFEDVIAMLPQGSENARGTGI
jgi:hypothetical protein